MLDTTANRTSYQGGEGRSVFPIPFPFLETAHIRAHVADTGGAKRALAPGVDYSVNRVSDAHGELILLERPLPPGSVLTICRLVPLTQEILFHNQGPNSPRAMEEAADKLTMIAQQLQSGIDNCLALPDGVSAGEAAEIIADSAGRIGRVRGDLASLAAQVEALRDAVAAAPPADDAPRPDSGPAVPAAHAASHAAGGDDPLRPEDLGVLPAPPADGKPYLAAAGGWIEYVAPVGGGDAGDGGGEGAGTLDHSQLANRDAADQHPQSAIQHLGRDLGDIRAAIAGVEEKAGVRLASGMGLELDAGGALRISADSLVSKTALDARLLGHDGRLDALDARTSALPSRLDSAESGLASLGGRLNALGAMAAAADAPKNGKPHLRQDGGWIEAPAGGGSGGGGGGGGAIVGEIRLLPFRAAALPAGWYFCNGDRYSLATAQGDALNSLPAQLKADWGIGASGGSINLPRLFDPVGVGYFLRPVDNATRVPGHKQTDGIRNITGTWSFDSRIGLVWANTPLGRGALSGAFTSPAPSKINSFATQPTGAASVADLYFDAAGSVPVAPENRPVNIGMTPAIYLGV